MTEEERRPYNEQSKEAEYQYKSKLQALRVEIEKGRIEQFETL